MCLKRACGGFTSVGSRVHCSLLVMLAWECSTESFLFPTSLTKDMTGKDDNYRGPAVRALCQITDVSAASLLGLP